MMTIIKESGNNEQYNAHSD